jgi:uncharacterized protein YbjT (DUF2867 family)
MATVPSAPRSALLVGATGLVGRELLPLLLDNERYTRVQVLARSSSSLIKPHPKLTLRSVNFTHLPNDLGKLDDAYIALGTTIKAAGSNSAFREVDFDYVLASARAAKAAGAHRIAVVSALGADPSSRVFYNRVKGEMEAAIRDLGFDSVVFAQPSLLLGDRASLGQAPRSGELWATRLLGPVMGLVPKGVRPIQARAVALAMVEATLSGMRGVRVLGSADMQSATPV